jgi:hypothetical protein
MCSLGSSMSRGLIGGIFSSRPSKRPPLCFGLIAASGLKRKCGAEPRKLPNVSGQVHSVLYDQVNDVIGRLDLASASEHRRGQDGAAVCFEDRWPDDEVCIGTFIFECDEHHAFRRTGHLPD